MEYVETVLKNSMKVLFVNTPGSTSGSVQMWFRAGSALENQSNQGIAHFLEHMFFKGTKKRPGAKMTMEIESFGGEVNAFTSFDYTCYYINFPANKLENSVDILLDMVTDPMFKNEDIVPERGVVYEEYLRGLDNPDRFAFGELQHQCFPAGYKHLIIGRESTIKNFSKEQLIEFRNSNYNSSNALLIVAGDLKKKDRIVNIIEKYKLPNGPKSLFPKFNLKKNGTIKSHKKDVTLTTITIAINATPFDHKETPARDLAMYILSLGQTSRLYKDLVLDDSKANSVSSSTMYLNSGATHFLKVNCPHKNIQSVLVTLKNTLLKAIKEGFTNEEVERIKNQYIASKIYEQETVEQFALNLGSSFAQNGDVESENKLIERVKQVSTATVNSALVKIFTSEFHINAQLPKGKSLEKTNKQLKTFSDDFHRLIRALLNDKESGVKAITSKYDENLKLVHLKKGVKLLYRKNSMTPTFVLQAHIKGGLAFETQKNNGIYSLLASTIGKGYGDVSYDDLRVSLENSSASLSGFSGKNAYGISMHGQTKDVTTLTKHFFGTLLAPTFPQKLFDHDKEITLRIIESSKKDPAKLCFNEFTKTIFQKHPYSMSTLGEESTVQTIRRDDLESLHRKNIAEKDILLTCCGDLDLEDIISIFEPYLSDIPEKKNISLAKNKKLTFDKAVRQDIKLDREQTHLFTGFIIPGLDEAKNISLKMLTTYLSGQSSELFTLLRDELGLCYAVQPVFFNALEAGHWGIYMATGTTQVDTSLAEIKKLMEKYQTKGISKKEFSRIKVMMSGQNSVNIQTNDDYAGIYSVPELHGFGMDFHHETQSKIEELVYDDFQKDIEEFLSSKWTTVTVGR